MGGAVLPRHFLERHSRALEIHEVELFLVKKKKTEIQAKNRVRDLKGSFFSETHPYNIKKQGGKRFPSQFYRLNFIQNFTKNEISTEESCSYLHGRVVGKRRPEPQEWGQRRRRDRFSQDKTPMRNTE